MEKRNIPHTIQRRKANWTGHILCSNCLLKYITEERIGVEVMEEEKDWMTLMKQEDDRN